MNFPKDQSLTSKLDRVPPCILRLMARGPSGKLATNSELKKRTGWGNSRLRRVSNATTFADITVNEADVFTEACGYKWSSQRRLLWLMSRAWRSGGLEIMRHLSFNTGWQASMIKRHQRRIEQLLSKKA